MLSAGLAFVVLEGCQGPGPLRDGASLIDRTAPRVMIEQGQMRAQGGCEYDYTLYRGVDGEARADVVLAHGFLRDRDRMAGLAQALADAGLTTLTLDLCAMRPWNGAHRENAVEMRRVAAQLGVARPIYAGFSAGGLAALLAAAEDPAVAGVMVLDLVDQAGMGRAAAEGLGVPVVGLFGDASACNADLNGVEVIEAIPRGEVIRIEGATHCDFESPTDGLCRLVCAPDGRDAAEEKRRRAEIIDRAVGAARKIATEVHRSGPAHRR